MDDEILFMNKKDHKYSYKICFVRPTYDKSHQPLNTLEKEFKARLDQYLTNNTYFILKDNEIFLTSTNPKQKYGNEYKEDLKYLNEIFYIFKESKGNLSEIKNLQQITDFISNINTNAEAAAKEPAPVAKEPEPAPADPEPEAAGTEETYSGAEGGGKRKRSRSSKKQNRRNSKKSRRSNKKVVNSKKNNNNNKNNNKKNNNNNNKKNNGKKNNNRNNNNNKSKKSKKNNKRK